MDLLLNYQTGDWLDFWANGTDRYTGEFISFAYFKGNGILVLMGDFGPVMRVFPKSTRIEIIQPVQCESKFN